MFRNITIGFAVAVALLSAPVTLPAYSMVATASAACTALAASTTSAAHITLAWPADGEAYIPSIIAGCRATTSRALITSIAFITSGTTSHSSPPLSASATAVAGSGCQRDGVGTECGFAIPTIEH